MSFNSSEYEPCDKCDCEHSENCSKIGFQYADISIPVELKSNTTLNKIEVECCGAPTVCCDENKCSKTTKLVICQTVNLKLPLKYEIVATAGESTITCSNQNDCCKKSENVF